MTAARVRVERVLALGARLADGDDAIGIEARSGLAATSGLHPAGIELALGVHLEARATPHEIDALLRSVSAAARCHVVLAANVCIAALRSIALAVATAPSVFVRPSRRDPVLAAILCRELAADRIFLEHGAIALLGDRDRRSDFDLHSEDEHHVYGSDETVAALRATAPPGVRLRTHGSGLGVAVVGAGVDPRIAAAAIARDVVPFDQRGCLSPRIVLVEGEPQRASAVAELLGAALTSLGERVPRGATAPRVEAEIAMYRRAIEAVGSYRAGAHHAVGMDPAPRALVLPPPARIVHVVPLFARSAEELLRPLAPFVIAVGANDRGDLTSAVIAIAPRARLSPLGEMQRPPFDGPVDLRTM